jgi:hypothetical protein
MEGSNPATPAMNLKITFIIAKFIVRFQDLNRPFASAKEVCTGMSVQMFTSKSEFRASSYHPSQIELSFSITPGGDIQWGNA